MPTHAYTTTVVSSNGSLGAETISIPAYFERVPSIEPLSSLVEELGGQPGAQVTAEALTDLLAQIAYETPAARRTSTDVVFEIVTAVAPEPILVLERSPAFGTTLAGALSQGPPA